MRTAVRHTDGGTDEHRDGHTMKQTFSHTVRHMVRAAMRHTVRHMVRAAVGHTVRHTAQHTVRHADRDLVTAGFALSMVRAGVALSMVESGLGLGFGLGSGFDLEEFVSRYMNGLQLGLGTLPKLMRMKYNAMTLELGVARTPYRNQASPRH